jgi:hypothetical protein
MPYSSQGVGDQIPRVSPVGVARRTLAGWGLRRWLVAAAAAAGVAALVGIPTSLVRTPYFTRMTPPLWWNYPVWVVSSMLAGITLATYYRSRSDPPGQGAGLTSGGLLTAFAVGCPLCNGLVVAALGTSGALSIWAPMQPWVAAIAVGLLAYAAVRRLHGQQGCPVPAAAGSTNPG